MNGRCSCGHVRYRLTDWPLVVHACHCTWCQRETGSAFALNVMIETDRLQILSGGPEEVQIPSASGKGQIVFRCPACRVALWSHYAGLGRKAAFVRVGTLENPGDCPPDVHIFTSTKLPWVVLADGVPARAEFYDRKEIWRPEAIARRAALLARS